MVGVYQCEFNMNLSTRQTREHELFEYMNRVVLNGARAHRRALSVGSIDFI